MKAVIFDLDGVIVSTDILHKSALIKAVYDVAIIDATFHPLISEKSMMTSREKLKKIQDYYKFDDSVYDRILEQKDKLFFESLSTIAVPGNVISALHWLKEQGIKTAIASNTRTINIKKILEATHTNQYFDKLISADEVENRKPAPDVIFLAYKKLKLKKKDQSDTLYIEDSDEGEEAGRQTPSTVLRINNPSDLTVQLLQQWIN
jgi:beta-phosphoglucomutase